MPLYNCHHDGDQYRITKFIEGTPEGSYLTTLSECTCPAGHRDTCRHRQMLPTFLDHELVNSPWFIDWDRRSWPCDFEGKVVTPATDADLVEQINLRMPIEQTVVEDTSPAPAPAPSQPWRRI